MTAELHAYQRYSVEYLLARPAAALFLDCGLGKTVVTLTAIFDLVLDSFSVRKVLVIAPLRVARDVWPAEIAKWDHLRGLTCAVAIGPAKQRREALLSRAHIHIINRENTEWLVRRSGLPFDYDMVVIDELSSFKAHQSKRFRALMKVRPRVGRVVGLTGTPAAGGLMDLWAEVCLLDMGERLGHRIGDYRETFFVPDRRNGQVIFSYKPRPGAEKAIHDKIADIVVSMRSVDHLQMPELVTTTCPVQMAPEEHVRYDELRRDLVTTLSGAEVTAVSAAVLAGKLCQMANGAVYGDDGKTCHVHDRKLDALEDLIEAAVGKPVLVAYWFRHDLERLRARFAVTQLDGTESIARWNRGDILVGVVHPASAGHGLNLQAGGATLVWFGLTWSLELYQQTIARIWRQGQKDTVVVHHILTRGTIDEQVMAALTRKDRTQAALIEAVRVSLRDGTPEARA